MRSCLRSRSITQGPGRATALPLVLALIGVSLVAAPAAAGPDTGLVAWWKFDEGAGAVAYDSSGNGNNVELVGSPQWTAGQRGGAISFNGVTDYLRVRERESLRSGPKTVAVWANAADFLKRYGGVYSWAGPQCSDSYYGFAHYSGAFGVYYENSSDAIIRSIYPAGAGTWKLGEWAHYAIVYDGEDMPGGRVAIYIYKNGVMQSPGYAGSDGLSCDCAMRVVGSQEDYPNPAYIRTFSGMMDDYRVYNRVLTAAEINDLYNQGRVVSTDAIAPSVPTGLTATGVSASKVDLSWNPSTDDVGVAGYLIYRDGASIVAVRTGTTYSDVAHTPTTIYWYTLTPSTSYTYTVAAFDAAYNVSAQSSPVSVTTPAATTSGPFTLSVTVMGSGASPTPNVVSSPAGISCSSGTCTASYPGGSYVYLTPYPFIIGWRDWNFTFLGWSGAGCSGNGECQILMDSDKAVTASYGTVTVYGRTVTFADECSLGLGNGNGNPEPGERLSGLLVEISNTGPVTATGCTAQLVSFFMPFTVEPPGASPYPDIGSTPVANTTPFAGDIGLTDFYCGDDIPLQIDLSCDQGSFTVPFVIPTLVLPCISCGSSCSDPAGPIAMLMAVKESTDVHLTWEADSWATDGYNAWYVVLETDIARATMANAVPAGPANPVPDCAWPSPARPSPECIHGGAIPGAEPLSYYQVKGLCINREGP